MVTLLFGLLTSAAAMRPVELTTEFLTEPLAVQTAQPRFSWKLDAPGYDQQQTAYEIVVSDDHRVVWSSGKVASPEFRLVQYAGEPLMSGQRLNWKVRVWDKGGQASSWSTSTFSVGKLKKSDWSAQWISYPDPAPPVSPANNGFHSELETTPDKQKFVQFDFGTSASIDKLDLWPARPYDWNQDAPGFLFPLRFRLDVSEDADFVSKTTVYEHTDTDLPNPGDVRLTLKFQPVKGRYLRLVVTKLAERNPGFFGFALAEMTAFSMHRPVPAKASASDSVESRDWGVEKLTDGDLHSHGTKGLDSLPATQVRKEFQPNGEVVRAVLYATALGLYEAQVNGSTVGPNILAPEWTDYHTRVQYQAYDVTNLVRKGANRISASIGDGWYAGRIGMAQALDSRGYPRGVYGRKTWFLGQLDLHLADGSVQSISTGPDWEAANDAHVVTSDLYDGEVQTLTDLQDWSKPMVSESPNGETPALLVGQPNEPIREVLRLRPVRMTEPAPGVYVFDMGQNMVGRARVKATVSGGKDLVLRHAEALNDDGTIYTTNLRGAPQIDRLIVPSTISGTTETTFEPKFTYHGFRFLELTGLAKPPKIEDVEGIVFCSSSPESAKFDCSDPMVNRLWQNILWTQRANLMSVPTDCPQRDERLGWSGDILAFAQTSWYMMDMGAFFTKWLTDFRDAQADDGRYPDFAPHPYGKDDRFTGVPGWGDAGVGCAYTHYSNTGDTRLLAEHLPSVGRWLDWIVSKNPDHIWRHARHNDYGDWLNGDTLRREGWDHTGSEVPKDVFATLIWYRSARQAADMCREAGQNSVKYDAMSNSIADAFLKEFVQPNGAINGDTQAGYALALDFDVLPESVRTLAVERLVRSIHSRGDVMTTGFHSTLPLLRVLTRYGHNDLAMKLLTNRQFPSWGYTIDNGATTIWERWDGYVKGRGFQDPGMNSLNHWALGSVGQWMMETVVGISAHVPSRLVTIAPRPGAGLTHADGSWDSHLGKIACGWKQEGKVLTIWFTVPAGTTAQFLPPAGAMKVTKGKEHLKPKENPFEYTAPSGEYAVTIERG